MGYDIPGDYHTGGPKKAVYEAVKHPEHYNMGNIEVIDAIESWKLGFNDGNAVKYISRARYKGTPVEDLKKALWYLSRTLLVEYGSTEEILCNIVNTCVKKGETWQK